MVARTFFLRTRPPWNSASPGPVIISTSAALTSIQPLSPDLRASAMSCSSLATRLSSEEEETAAGEEAEAPCVAPDCAQRGAATAHRKPQATRVNPQYNEWPLCRQPF